MNTRPDEFDGIFDDLTPQDFAPLSTVTFPAESTHFDELVTARLEAVRLAYTPGESLSHAVLSNGKEVRQLAPDGDDETMGEFLQRLARNARNMHAHSFFFCRIIDASATVEISGFCVLWIAHHLDNGEQILRTGFIPIENDQLGEVGEATMNAELSGSIGEAFMHVLMP